MDLSEPLFVPTGDEVFFASYPNHEEFLQPLADLEQKSLELEVPENKKSRDGKSVDKNQTTRKHDEKENINKQDLKMKGTKAKVNKE